MPEHGILKDELWRVRTDGSQPEMLFQSQSSPIDDLDPDYRFARVGNIQFSPDGDKVYFEASEWVTSGALHVINPDGSGHNLLGGRNDTKIILSAHGYNEHKDLKGYIVTNQHRYGYFGGAYDWYWLYTPDWKEVDTLGDSLEYFTAIGEIKYTDGSEKELKAKEK